MRQFIVLLWILFGATIISAQQEIVLKSNVTDLLVGRYSIGLEKGLNESLSFGIEFDYLSRDVFLESDHPWYEPLSTRKKGVIFEPQLRWYPNGRCLKGFYASFAGFFGIAVYEPYSGELNNRDWSTIGASLYIGRQILLGRFILDGYFGGTWADDDYPGPYYESRALFPAPDGLRFSGGLRCGLSF